MWKYFKWSTWRRIYFKVVKHEGTPESLAMGVALGVFAGFIVPTGGQMIIAVALAFMFKANKTLAVMGTLITNPYTAPFFMPAECWLGAIMMGDPLEFHVINMHFQKLLADPSWETLKSLGFDLLIPLLIGGAAFSVIFAIPSYYITLAWVRNHRRRKAEKMLKRNAVAPAAEELPPPPTED